MDSVNAHMKNQPLNLGVIVPPDDHYRPVLYSDVRASYDFYNINKDIYQRVKHSKNLNEKQTPLSVKILASIVALGAGIFGITKLIKR